MNSLQREILPLDSRPMHYKLTLESNLETFQFSYECTIEVEILRSTKDIVMNSLALTVDKAWAVVDKIEVECGHSLNADLEQLTLHFPDTLPAGLTLTLTITGLGLISDSLLGYYRSSYSLPHSSRKHYLGCTQFQPVDARRAFPCWDEPSYKATFEINLVAPSGMIAISNMPVKTEESLPGGRTSFQFETTPRMSTYLVAWVVGDLEHIEKKVLKGNSSELTTVRIYTVPGVSKHCHFALDVAAKVLPFYEKYFELDFPLPKSDCVALPDMSMGGMENWGLIAYRENALVCQEGASARQKERVVTIITHEFAHQWFGNLVTMSWWNELWLNEGFATFMQFFAADALFPEWGFWGLFVKDVMGEALGLDALESSHAIEVPVCKSREISEIFDSIAYCKGAAVIRMIQNYIGPEHFRQGLVSYLKANQYSNTTKDELWKHLQQASGKDIKYFISEWIERKGYPVIRLFAAGDSARLHQTRFLAQGTPTTEQDGVWKVPLCCRMPNKCSVQILFEEKEEELVEVSVEKWAILNADRASVCRSHYEGRFARLLIEGLAKKDPGISSLDKHTLLNDGLALSKCGIQSTVTLLELMECMKDEEADHIWESIVEICDYLSNLLQKDHDVHLKFNLFVKNLLASKARAVGWESFEGESHRKRALRSALLFSLCKAGHGETLAQSLENFAQFMSGNSSLDRELLAPILYAAARKGGPNSWARLMEMALNTSDVVLSLEAIKFLGVGERETVESALNACWQLRPHDIRTVLQSVAGNVQSGGPVLAMAFLKKNWTKLNRLLSGAFLIPNIVESCCGSFVTEEDLQECEAWWGTLSPEERLPSERSFYQAVESCKNNMEWRERAAKSVSEWLALQGY